MDAYPLSDAPPPRYAVESDDEDEYNSLSPRTSGSGQPSEVKVEFKSIYGIPSKKPLVFVSREAGVSWARIINLGEQQAGIYVNRLPVGSLFCPSWTNAIVVVSEAEIRTRLPLFAMTTYTTAMIERLQPTSVAILDSYPTQTYISPQVIPQDRAPIRYLSVARNPIPDPTLELFAPPNLLQSTTASLMNELFLRSIDSEEVARNDTAIILLPTPKPSTPAPVTFDRKGFSGDFASVDWARETLGKAHKCLFAILGETVGQSSLLDRAESGVRLPVSHLGAIRSSLGEVGEGGMYI